MLQIASLRSRRLECEWLRCSLYSRNAMNWIWYISMDGNLRRLLGHSYLLLHVIDDHSSSKEKARLLTFEWTKKRFQRKLTHHSPLRCVDLHRTVWDRRGIAMIEINTGDRGIVCCSHMLGQLRRWAIDQRIRTIEDISVVWIWTVVLK